MKDLIGKLLRESLNEVSDETYQLLKTKYKDARTIMTKDETISAKDTVKQDNRHKPSGLWYGIGSEWVDWVRSEVPEWEAEYMHILDVDLNKMVVIRTYDELLSFTEAYGDEMAIDWGRVANDYHGIEIAPYIHKARLELMWYYTWDIASGCIWNTQAIKGINKI